VSGVSEIDYLQGGQPMTKQFQTLVTAIFVLVGTAAASSAQQSPAPPQPPSQTQQQPLGPMGPGMMGPGFDMGRWRRGRAMRIIFALMDSDADGTVSWREFQAAQERIFKAMDSNKDGVLTLEEMQAFRTGIAPSPQPSGAPTLQRQ
jgi:hypothetical protein